MKKKISPPHSVSSSFLPNGMQFNHKIKNENGDEFSIENLEGNVVIIVFFTTWCPSCPTVLENMDYLTEKFREEGIDNVKIIPLNLGNESVDYLKIYYKGSDLQLLNVYHSLPPGAMSAIRGVPCCLIFDKSGTPACGYLGAENYRSGEFIEYIKKLAQQ
ncbi:MAG: TlpA family protein disulfide reductase [Holosporaceae bacterium]|nr:TlpA family protein disulfide reductase [Holosporaceae bacterium]